MTALVLENLAALPALRRSIRKMLTHLARALDALVSARAARQIPDWQMCEIENEIGRYKDIIRAGDLGRGTRANH